MCGSSHVFISDYWDELPQFTLFNNHFRCHREEGGREREREREREGGRERERREREREGGGERRRTAEEKGEGFYYHVYLSGQQL